MTRSGGAALPIAGVSLLTLAMLGVAVIAGAATPSDSARADGLALDIPPAYLAAYQAASDRFALGADGWSYLAAIGEVETDHGRSSAPGVRSGQNTNGCCAGPMQIHNGYGSGAGTWGRFKVDGDADGRTDIYDPDDAIATAAAYLRASGAPRDWRAAIFAYNHSGAYVSQVLSRAAAYRQGGVSAPVTVVRGGSGAGLAPLPDFPGERCDVRIIPDVEFLVRAYGVAVTDCFGGPPHELAGEHPLGLAVDVVPVDGDWNRTRILATRYGWSPACARAGCAGRGPFRVILYNGYPGHGDPAHSTSPHLHLSWQHAPAAPFTRAAWVRVLAARSKR